VFILKQFTDKRTEMKEETYIYIYTPYDYVKAFDKVNRVTFWTVINIITE